MFGQNPILRQFGTTNTATVLTNIVKSLATNIVSANAIARDTGFGTNTTFLQYVALPVGSIANRSSTNYVDLGLNSTFILDSGVTAGIGIFGGNQNVAGGSSGGVYGGSFNKSTGDGSVIVGGRYNTNGGDFATFMIGGFSNNVAQVNFGGTIGGSRLFVEAEGVIVGGNSNHIGNDYSVINGGQTNDINGSQSVIDGGANNILGSAGVVGLTVLNSAIIGGRNNTVPSNSLQVVVLSGQNNTLTGSNAVYAGVGMNRSVTNKMVVGMDLEVTGTYSGSGSGLTNLPITALQGSGGAATAAANGTAGQVLNSAGNGGVYWAADAGGFTTPFNVSQFSVGPAGKTNIIDGALVTNMVNKVDTSGAGIFLRELSSGSALLAWPAPGTSGLTVGGGVILASGTFDGSGANITALNANALTSGTVPLAALGNALTNNRSVSTTFSNNVTLSDGKSLTLSSSNLVHTAVLKMNPEQTNALTGQFAIQFEGSAFNGIFDNVAKIGWNMFGEAPSASAVRLWDAWEQHYQYGANSGKAERHLEFRDAAGNQDRLFSYTAETNNIHGWVGLYALENVSWYVPVIGTTWASLAPGAFGVHNTNSNTGFNFNMSSAANVYLESNGGAANQDLYIGNGTGNGSWNSVTLNSKTYGNLIMSSGGLVYTKGSSGNGSIIAANGGHIGKAAVASTPVAFSLMDTTGAATSRDWSFQQTGDSTSQGLNSHYGEMVLYRSSTAGGDMRPALGGVIYARFDTNTTTWNMNTVMSSNLAVAQTVAVTNGVMGQYAYANSGTGAVTITSATLLFTNWNYSKVFGGISALTTNTTYTITNAGDYRIQFGARLSTTGNGDVMSLNIVTNDVTCSLISLQFTSSANVKDETGFKSLVLALPANCRVGLNATNNTPASTTTVTQILLDIQGAN